MPTTETKKAAKRCGQCLSCRMARASLRHSLTDHGQPPFSNVNHILQRWEAVDVLLPCIRRN